MIAVNATRCSTKDYRRTRKEIAGWSVNCPGVDGPQRLLVSGITQSKIEIITFFNRLWKLRN